MNSADVYDKLEEIAATASRLRKDELVTEALGDELFQRVVRLACDPFVTFGVTPPKVKDPKGRAVFGIDSAYPWVVLQQLADRTLSGNAAKDAVERLLDDHEGKSANVIWRILAKDLRAGFSKNTVNRAMPGTIPTFDVMLSKSYEEKRIKTFPVGVEPKLDGFRTMFLVKDGQAKAFSRVGNHFPAYDHLSEMIVQTVDWARTCAIAGEEKSKEHAVWARILRSGQVAIDAETMSGAFAETSGAARRKDEQAKDVVVHVFDALPYGMATGPEAIVPIPFKIRRRFAEFIVSCAPAGAPIRMTELDLAGNHEEIQAIYERHRAAGREGAMVKPLDGPYEKKKGHGWMKMKAEETEDLRISGWFEGKAGTKLEGKFGGFIVDRINPADGQIVKVRVGGGYSDAQREEFEQACRDDEEELERNGATIEDPSFDGKPRALIRLVEVEFHEVTPDGSLRHPRFVRFRDDKDEQLKDAA